MKIKFIIPFIVVVFIMSSCAKRGTPEGGPIDEDPPRVLREVPPNNSVFFNDQRIRIFFKQYLHVFALFVFAGCRRRR